jgi:phosphoribosylanthranilate isomerase
MSIFVKICGLKESRHVQAAVDAGADAVGFVFAKSVRRVSPAAATAISANLPAGIKRVAVMLHPDPDEWLDVLRIFAPDVLQTDAGDFAALDVPDSVARWPVHRQGKGRTAVRGTYVYEGQQSGQGESVDWSRAAGIARKGNMILAGGLTAANVAAAIATVRPYGVDVSSAVEAAPGQKDVRLIHDFVSAAKAAEKNL